MTLRRREAGPITIDQCKLLRLARIPACAGLCAPCHVRVGLVSRSYRAVRSRSEYASRWPVGFGWALLPLGRRADECQSWKEVSRSTEGLSSVGASTE